MKPVIILLASGVLLASCGVGGRLANVGRAPKMTPVADIAVPAVEPSLGSQGASHRGGALPAGEAAAPSASLYRTGVRAFFRDQRASSVGDIVTVKINIADKADVNNTTQRSRTGGETAGVPALLGLEKGAKFLPGSPDPAKLVEASSSSTSSGSGTTARAEKIDMTVAAIVTDVLPNGNLVIRGRQEVRVNFELRELIITGIVRPEDISRDNSIRHSQIAEARISYGGRGQISDAQQARWGQQIYDALFPF